MTLTNSNPTTEDFADVVEDVIYPCARLSGAGDQVRAYQATIGRLCDVIRGLADGINDEIIVAEDSDTGLTVQHLLDDPFDLSADQAELVVRLLESTR